MPNQTVVVGGKTVVLGDKDYLASGGEATVFVKGGEAYRIQHDPKTLPPSKKLGELMQVKNKYAVTPKELIQTKAGETIGFTMPFLSDTEPVCKLFNRIFRQQNNILPKAIGDLVENLRATMGDIHGQNCRIVDFNEMNILVPTSTWDEGYIIDTASWATASFPPTAIMQSIRDPKVRHNRFTTLSDWYSWGIISFQLYTGVHPFKGKHPSYKPSEWYKRMEENASVFDTGVVLPPTVEPFNRIPARHLEWYKGVFQKGERTPPPAADGSIQMQVIPAAVTILNNKGKFTVTQVYSAPGPLLQVFHHNSRVILVGADSLYTESGAVLYSKQRPDTRRLQLLPHSNGIAVIEVGAKQITYFSLETKAQIGETSAANGVFVRGDKAYVAHPGELAVETVVTLGKNQVIQSVGLETLGATAKLYDGCVVQDFFETTWLSIPTPLGYSKTVKLKEIGRQRVIQAKYDQRVAVLITKEHGTGKYNRHVLVFDQELDTYFLRTTEDVALEEINFTVVPRGPAVLYVGDAIEVFSAAIPKNVNRVDDPPFDANMPLGVLGGTTSGVCFISGNTVHKVSMK